MDSDSENDSDYVPQKDDDYSESEGRATKRARTNALLETATSSKATENKKGDDEIYAQFKAALTTPSKPTKPAASPEMVKVVKRYRFAGEEVTEVKEVPAHSDEAKKWPLWTPSTTSPKDASTSEADDGSSVVGVAAASPASAKSFTKRPGPRKPRGKLADIPSRNEPVKKLTTLDKSAMDWRAHVEGDSSKPMKEELESNRRGGGYLEKVEFLQRVETRKEEVLDASKGKRRR